MIEVVVVVAILGIVAVAVTPEISLQLRNSQIRNAAEAMTSGLNRARAEAISRNQNVRFTLVNDLSTDCAASATAGSWVVSLDDPAGKCDSAPSNDTEPRIVTVHTARDGNADARVSATVQGTAVTTTAANSVIFNSFGRPVNASQLGQIVLDIATATSSHRSYRVVVSATGSVRMCDIGVVTSSDDPRRCPF